MSLERLRLEHVPASYTIHATLFRDVANAAFLHGQLLARNADFAYAFVDAAALQSRLHALAAVFRGVHADVTGALKTPNVHSEIVCALSPNNNIADAYRRFGISPATKDVLIVKVTRNESSETTNDSGTDHVGDSIWKHLEANVEGRPVPFTDEEIAACTDWARLRKVYKLNGVDAGNKCEMEMLSLGGMALRSL